MNPELKQKWLQALRSGQYKQTKERLKGKYGYCCLGVLCDVSGRGEWTKTDTGWSFRYPDAYYSDSLTSVDTDLESDLLNEFKLDSATQNFLVALNDGTSEPAGIHEGSVLDPATGKRVNVPKTGRKFKEIADWIEKNL